MSEEYSVGYDAGFQEGRNAAIDEFVTEISQLQAENAALKDKAEMDYAIMAGDAALIEGLKAELAAAQKDAERYRWLRDHDNDLWIAMIEAIKVGGEAMEAAIDKEMGK